MSKRGLLETSQETNDPDWNVIITGEYLLSGRCECVYAWFRDDQCLYIGHTGKGFSRIFGHNVVGIVEAPLPTDEIKVFFVKDTGHYEGLVLETKLLRKYRPKYNKSFGYFDESFQNRPPVSTQLRATPPNKVESQQTERINNIWQT